MIRFIKRIVYCFVGLLTFLLLMYLVAFCVGEPELNKDRYIKLYDDQNEIFYQSINNYSGQYVSLENVNPYFLKAIVSIEDKRFYQHHGFDYVGISRAIKTNVIKRKNSQGASTITQQYARLLYLTNEKTWSRKVKEAFFTLQLETHLSKDKILEGYVTKPTDYHYINHSQKKYGNVPLWVLTNALTFGNISKMYMLLPQDIQIKVSRNYQCVNEKQMVSILAVLVKFRNVCAHGERLLLIEPQTVFLICQYIEN